MAETKRCPFCGEEIMVTAKKCKHCGEWLDKSAKPVTTPTALVDKPKKDDEEITAGTYAAGCALGGGIILLYWGAIIGAILFVLHITVPSRERMIECVMDGAVSEMQDQADNISSLFGDDANLLTNLLTSTDAVKKGMAEMVLQYNHVEVDEGLFWSVAYLHNDNLGPEGERAGFGILGITIPLVMWEDLQMTGSLTGSSSSSAASDAVDELLDAADEVVDVLTDDSEPEVDYELPDYEE